MTQMPIQIPPSKILTEKKPFGIPSLQNYDPDVRTDLNTFLNHVVPEGPKAPWVHTMEGE
jgi:hypothetical protein